MAVVADRIGRSTVRVFPRILATGVKMGRYPVGSRRRRDCCSRWLCSQSLACERRQLASQEHSARKNASIDALAVGFALATRKQIQCGGFCERCACKCFQFM